MFIFIDESGDIGLTKKYITRGISSSYYCLGVVAYKDGLETIQNLIEKTRNDYFGKYKKRLPIEIKYAKLKKEARTIICQRLLNSEAQLYILSLNKLDHTKKVADWSSASISEPLILREILTLLFENIFINSEYKLNLDEKVGIFFDEGIHTKYAKILERQTRKYAYKIRIHKPQDSKQNAGVQLADVLAGSFHHYLKGDKTSFNMLKDICKVSEIRLEHDKNIFRLTHSKVIIN